jgi:hypothetical protein
VASKAISEREIVNGEAQENCVFCNVYQISVLKK